MHIMHIYAYKTVLIQKFIHIFKMHIYAYLVLHMCAYFVHTYAEVEVTSYALRIWYFCIYVHILFLHILAYLSLFYAYFNLHIMEFFTLMHIPAYNAYLFILHISYLLICAYSCRFGTPCCCIFRAYFCIFK